MDVCHEDPREVRNNNNYTYYFHEQEDINDKDELEFRDEEMKELMDERQSDFFKRIKMPFANDLASSEWLSSHIMLNKIQVFKK